MARGRAAALVLAWVVVAAFAGPAAGQIALDVNVAAARKPTGASSPDPAAPSCCARCLTPRLRGGAST